MKKRLLTLLSALLVVAMLLSLCACGAKEESDDTDQKKDKETEQVAQNAELNDFLVAEKIGNIGTDIFSTTAAGLYYKGENGLYGTMSPEGLYDTGAVYTFCEADKTYFQVSKTLAEDFNDIAGLNCRGLTDGKGKVLVPFEYADLRVIDDRYVQVMKVTAPTDNEEEQMVYYINGNGATKKKEADKEKYMFKGTWQIFDMTTGAVIPGLISTKRDYPGSMGKFIQYQDENAKYQTVDDKGKAKPEGSRVFSDGSYYIEKDGAMYDTNGNKLFEVDPNGYTPSDLQGDYYLASKYDDGSTYVVMNKKGEIVSKVFDEYITIYGELLIVDEKVYNFQGENIVEGTHNYAYLDRSIGKKLILRNSDDDISTMVDAGGNVFFSCQEDDDTYLNSDTFVAITKKGEDYYCYSHADKDYTIKGYSFAPWVAKVSEPNYLYSLVDTMTGKKLLEGYKGYTHTKLNDIAYYVYAKYDGGADIYLVIANSRLAEVNVKKQNLLGDLTAAFEAEGITVTVNKENGEISLDSSVLFGGDSAVLTADGKAFLNKFIKAYTSIAFSDKYNGFISKTMVEGHAAPVTGSTYESALELSQQRADNVKAYCLSAESGADVSKLESNLEALGYSISQPVYNADGTVNMEASRRVSFRFMVSIDL